MVLIGVKDDGNWLLSRWNLTYRIGWQSILKAANAVYDFYEDIQILVNGKAVDIHDKEELSALEEDSSLTFRGFSKIIGVPLTITLFNQTDIVDAGVAKATEEFRDTDYKRFNISLCQYMDSIELAMHR